MNSHWDTATLITHLLNSWFNGALVQNTLQLADVIVRDANRFCQTLLFTLLHSLIVTSLNIILDRFDIFAALGS